MQGFAIRVVLGVGDVAGVGNDGALGGGVNCSRGMDGSRKTMRWYICVCFVFFSIIMVGVGIFTLGHYCGMILRQLG